MLFVHVQQDVIFNSQQRCFCAIYLPIRWLIGRVKIVHANVTMSLVIDGWLCQLRNKCKLLTGRKFLKRMSRPGFLSNGKTKAFFQATGNWPDFKDILINLVSTGSRTSHRLTKVEGIGSRAQDFRDECCIRDFTSCSVNILNSVRWTKDDSMPSMSG